MDVWLSPVVPKATSGQAANVAWGVVLGWRLWPGEVTSSFRK